jgi:hypothetical protein
MNETVQPRNCSIFGRRASGCGVMLGATPEPEAICPERSRRRKRMEYITTLAPVHPLFRNQSGRTTGRPSGGTNFASK